jgi:hypothetical protein
MMIRLRSSDNPPRFAPFRRQACFWPPLQISPGTGRAKIRWSLAQNERRVGWLFAKREPVTHAK